MYNEHLMSEGFFDTEGHQLADNLNLWPNVVHQLYF